jgi:hypothetical protein
MLACINLGNGAKTYGTWNVRRGTTNVPLIRISNLQGGPIMAWTDWLKDIPVSAAIKERLALKEEQFNELKTENGELTKRIGALEAENSELKSKLRIHEDKDRFVDYRGVFWKRKLGGGFEATPFCPSCTFVMHIYVKSYECRRCNIKTFVGPQQVPNIISEIEVLTKELPRETPEMPGPS